MTVQQEVQSIISCVKEWNWTPELFQRVNNILNYTNIFNILRRELTVEEYEQFDTEYCEYFKPGQKGLAKYIREERRREEWKNEDLHQMSDRKLLRLLKQLKRENLV